MTGATGFLGRSLVPHLERRYARVIALGSRDADLADPRSLDACAAEPIATIYHLAAWTQAGDFCLHHPGEQWLINQQINTTVLAWWARSQRDARMVTIGTSCAYPVELPLKEENYLSGTPFRDLFTYAMTKRMLQIGLESLHRQFGMRYLTLVPSTLYGPDYHQDGRQLHFIFDLIRKLLHARDTAEDAVLWGDGQQRRELVDVGDFVRLMQLLEESAGNRLVNIGAGEDHSIREFAGLICRVIGLDPRRVRYDTAAYVGARSKVLDTTLQEALVPGFQRTPLEDGLTRTIRWMESCRTGTQGRSL